MHQGHAVEPVGVAERNKDGNQGLIFFSSAADDCILDKAEGVIKSGERNNGPI